MTIGDEIKTILHTVQRAENKADDALLAAFRAEEIANRTKGDVIKMTSQVVQAFNCGQEIRGKQAKLEQRVQDMEVAGGVRPANDVWVKMSLVAFGSAAAGMILVALAIKYL